MSYNTILDLIFIFLVYSFIGWTLEVISVAIKEGKFVNRGITNGPLCPIYGFSALVILLITRDTTNILGIFLASIIYGTLIEFIVGKLLEKIDKVKWWNYSNKKFNFDGYICLEYSLLWGFLGVLLVKIVNPLLLSISSHINFIIKSIVLITLFAVAILDFITSFITIKIVNTQSLNNISNKMGNFILTTIHKRIEEAYPNVLTKTKNKTQKRKVFAQGLSFHKLFLIFLIGAFIGDLCEIVFCRYSMHRWMSRSSLVWGQFSIVWGFGMALATLCLYRYKDGSNILIFIVGSIMGGAFEYVCSVFTEVFFGTIFWDYSKLPFNLNGRINLLFCFFWGIAALLIIKKIYPFLSKWIEKIPMRIGRPITNILFVLFIIDLFVTGCVMMRYHARNDNIEATNIVEKLCDKYAPDEYMAKRWSNMKNVNKNSQKND